MKKLTYIITSILIILSLSSFGQRDSKFNDPKKRTFETNGFGETGDTKAGAPPDPGGGGTGGNPVPISGGFLLLAGGLFAYSLTNKSNKTKDA